MNDTSSTPSSGCGAGAAGPGDHDGECPFVSVIVPVYNGADTIERLIEALLAQDYPADRYECIVADDASTDETARLAARYAPRIRLISCRGNSGSYAARNLGVGAASGTILAFTDADCAPAPGWLAAGVLAMQRQQGGLVAGAVTITPTDRQSAVQRYDAAFGILQEVFAVRAGFGATANLFVHRSAMTAVGGFDGALRSGGDHQFCKDARRHGLPFGYCAESLVHHVPRTTFSALMRKQMRVSGGLVHIHPRWSQLRPMMVPLKAWRRRSFAPITELDREGWSLRMRFAIVYYALLAIGMVTYGNGCLVAGRPRASHLGATPH